MIPKNIDEKTTELLNDLRTDVDISFEVKNINYCGVFQINKTATIYYNPKIVDTESIAHELLHIWLKRFDYSIGNRFFLYNQSDDKLSKIFDKPLCDHISNCCDHFKMYPKYLDMGYSPEKFLQNGLALQASIYDVKSIELKFSGGYNSKSINFFIGFLFSILADHIKENDYTEHHKYLLEKEPQLYNIIYDFWNKWEKFDIENIDPIYNSDLDLTEFFIEEIEEWGSDKTIV